ncbi:MAG TPA: SAM-dependent methyltransferase [Streptosporangiaceae bacterium]|nr:SAM-dependent methyltransferase [Streptosporangiaceae bacterium]
MTQDKAEDRAPAGPPGWVPPGVDTRRANPARVYDYWLGGTHNFLADQDLGRAMAAVEPAVRDIARANRAFLGRAVSYLAAEAGVDQFLDIGSGIPTQGNVHEVTARHNPRARVLYADIDAVAVAHSKAILAGHPTAAVISADVRQPGDLLAQPGLALLDLAQPAALLLVAVLHFISDDDDPWQIVATLRDALAPDSYLVLAHATNESRPGTIRAAEKIYQRGVPSEGRTRSRAEILRFFDGFDLLDPGLVYLPQWRPADPADVPEDPARLWFLAGVARKP